MPLDICFPDVTDSITLDEFVAIAKSNYDFYDESALIDAARHLKRLANNREFLLDLMFLELGDPATFQQKNFYGPQVFLIHREKDYFLRANVWRPLSAVEKQIKGHVYDVCHDHNFDILTVGYFGPGYRARTYTYDVEQVTGVLGEKVDLNYEGIFSLAEGQIALYRAKKDVHIQLPPEDISVSLNLIPRNAKVSAPQFQFDEDSRTICRYLHGSGSELVVRIAGLLGGEATSEVLEQIAVSHPNSHLRALAAVSRSQLGSDGNLRPAADPSYGSDPLTADIMKRELEEYGACLRLVSD